MPDSSGTGGDRSACDQLRKSNSAPQMRLRNHPPSNRGTSTRRRVKLAHPRTIVPCPNEACWHRVVATSAADQPQPEHLLEAPPLPPGHLQEGEALDVESGADVRDLCLLGKRTTTPVLIGDHRPVANPRVSDDPWVSQVGRAGNPRGYFPTISVTHAITSAVAGATRPFSSLTQERHSSSPRSGSASTSSATTIRPSEIWRSPDSAGTLAEATQPSWSSLTMPRSDQWSS